MIDQTSNFIKKSTVSSSTRNQGSLPIGMHYLPDALHYREQDLQTWLPELQALGARSLTLIAPLERAIPEAFITNLIKNGIEPILHFPLSVNLNYQDEKNLDKDFSTLFENYARWGVRYVVLFDRPNLRRNWPASAWAQPNLTERFLDVLLPLLNLARLSGLSPILPPLEPGGDYWDTAFLQSILRGILRREGGPKNNNPASTYLPPMIGEELVHSLSLAAYAWTYNRPVDWGAGGPERWPAAQPYCIPANSQDQIGFHIFDWYDAIARAETGITLPIFILRAGSRLVREAGRESSESTKIQHAIQNLEIARHLLELINPSASVLPPTNKSLFSGARILDRAHVYSSPKADSSGEASISGEIPIQTLNFWLLSSTSNSPEAPEAWYQPDGSALPVVTAFKQWLTNQKSVATQNRPPAVELSFDPGVEDLETSSLALSTDDRALQQELSLEHALHQRFPIQHYLLLPIYAWGVAEWDIEAIRPFLQQYHPTLGFSLEEARLARRVTIYGDPAGVSPEVLISLIQEGCQVERINQDGTLLAL